MTPCALSFRLSTVTVLGQRRRLRRIGQRELARFHSAERLLENLFHFRGLDVAEDGNDAVLRDEIAIAEIEQIFLGQLRDRFHRAFAAERIGMLAEKRLAQNIARDGRQLLFVFLDPGELNFLFARDRFLRHRRVEQDIGEQLRAQFQIGLSDIERDAETVVAGVAADAAADGLDRVGDLFGGARLRAFQEHLRHQARDAVCLRRLGQKSAAKNRRHRDQRQPRIFPNEKAQSIRELDLLDLPRGDRLGRFGPSPRERLSD